MAKVSCPVCLTTNEASVWEKSTGRRYDIVVPINDPMSDGALYICPCCSKQSAGRILTIDNTLAMA